MGHSITPSRIEIQDPMVNNHCWVLVEEGVVYQWLEAWFIPLIQVPLVFLNDAVMQFILAILFIIKSTSTPPGHTMHLIAIYKSNWFILSPLVSSCIDFQIVRTAAWTWAHLSLLCYFWILSNTIMCWPLHLILVSHSCVLLMGVPISSFRFFGWGCSIILTSTCDAPVRITVIFNNLLWLAITGLQL